MKKKAKEAASQTGYVGTLYLLGSLYALEITTI